MQTELNKVVAALQEFYAREAFLFEKDLGERTLTHRLAVHLERQFSGWIGRVYRNVVANRNTVEAL